MTRLKTWERRANRCKKKHRPKLSSWSKEGWASYPRREKFESLKKKFLEQGLSECPVDSREASELSVQEFINKYEVPMKAVIIRNIPQHCSWPAHEKWNFERLSKKLGRRYFKVGEDDDGYSLKMRLKHFLKYLKFNKDDSPLYIFDSRFENDSESKSLLDDYKVPPYFPEDLFSMVGEKRRPPYRWFLVGPARSGTTVHIDPLGTSAWNTVLIGLKLWVLFPPGTPKRLVKCLDFIRKGEDDEAINYFVDFLPRLQASHPDVDIQMFLQRAGETVFVPGGWWHGVLNLEDSIAITQNYCSTANFGRVWIRTKKGRKKMAVKWRRLLGEQRPELAQVADMWDSVQIPNSL